MSTKNRIPPSLLPHTVTRKYKERVLDARICVLSGCRFFDRSITPDGRAVGSCKAGVFKAELPLEPLGEELNRNPSPVPGYESEDNPFLLRLLMSPDCVRPECGVATIEHQERVLSPDPDEFEEPLFP